jgi:hypothetical protein
VIDGFAGSEQRTKAYDDDGGRKERQSVRLHHVTSKSHEIVVNEI